MNTQQQKWVRNPLTVIAIFAGIIEAALTLTLINLPETNQEIFIWFVMFATILLISLFFYVLYKKPAVLFSPSDYADESKYLDSIGVSNDIAELQTKVSQMEQLLDTVIDLTDSLTSSDAQANAEALSREKQKLEHLRNFRALEDNDFYNFLSKDLKLSYEIIRQVLFNTSKVEEVVEAIRHETGDERLAERTRRIVDTFPRVSIDYEKLNEYFSSSRG
ncbi:MAG: hypothetical protein H6926_04770 [Chromatiales bacterium]|nr:hypothetical protein [Chromatiales bacterium]